MFCFPDQLFQGLVEVVGFDGLGEMGGHADLQGALDIFVKGICRQAMMGMRFASSLSRARMAAVASRPFISGMRTSMRMAS